MNFLRTRMLFSARQRLFLGVSLFVIIWITRSSDQDQQFLAAETFCLHPPSSTCDNNSTGLRFRCAKWEFKEENAKYLKILGFNEENFLSVNEGLPEFTFVTGFSENHAGEARHLVYNFSKAYPERTLVVYGMNVAESSRQWMKDACNVDFREFDFSRFPPHVKKTKNYAFKSLLIAEALKEFGSVLWMDTSTILSGMNTKDLIKSLPVDEEQPQVFIFHANDHGTYAATYPDMYCFLPPYNLNSLKLARQFEAGRILFYRTRSTMDLLMKWWVLCSLEEACIAPRNAQLQCNFNGRYYTKYAGCHRYDQSSLNIIASPYPKCFMDQKIGRKFLETKRGISLSYETPINCK